jgi:hypothetical protein
VDTEAYLKARAAYSASFMSNSKWVRLFAAVARSGIVVEQACWRLIPDFHGFWQGLPKERELLPNRFQDGRFQPFEFKWIESIFVPREYRPVANVGYTKGQDVARLQSVLEAAGHFMVRVDDAGLTIVAYQR